MSSDNPRVLSREAIDSLLGEGTYDAVHEGLPEGFDLCIYSDGVLAVDEYIRGTHAYDD